MNKVILTGNLGKDPEKVVLPSGTIKVKFSLATTERSTNADGDKVEHTEWHNIVTWGKQAETAAEFLKKGRKVLVEGRIQSRSWETDGAKRYITEIIASHWEFLDSPNGKKKEASSQNESDSSQEEPMI